MSDETRCCSHAEDRHHYSRHDGAAWCDDCPNALDHFYRPASTVADGGAALTPDEKYGPGRSQHSPQRVLPPEIVLSGIEQLERYGVGIFRRGVGEYAILEEWRAHDAALRAEAERREGALKILAEALREIRDDEGATFTEIRAHAAAALREVEADRA